MHLAEAVLPAVARVRGDEVGRPRVLPDERVVQRRTGVAVPEHRRLALIGDADGRELAGADAAARERLADHGLRVAPDLRGVVLDPAGFRIDLLVLALRDGDDRSLLIEHHEAAARRALIDRADVLAHGRDLSRMFERRHHGAANGGARPRWNKYATA